MVERNGQRVPGIQSTTGICFWPAIRAQSRLMNGDEDNVWDYYQELIKPPAPAKPQ